MNSPPMRGNRGGGNPNFFRGNRGGAGGGPNRFNNPNFDPSWGPPPMFGAPPPMAFGNQQELWVETKTEDGKSYYYHAMTRETTWTRPEGPNVKIMAQNEVEAMQSAKNQQQMPPAQQLQSPSPQHTTPKSDHTEETAQLNGDGKFGAGNGNAATNEPEMNGKTLGTRSDPNDGQAIQQPGKVQQQSQPVPMQMPPTQNQQPPIQMQPPFNAPPPFAYGMPPPGYMQYPPGAWPMPWQQPAPQPMGVDMPAKSLISKPGVIEPQVIARAAEWSEHRAPDGRPYYYNASRGESVWEKPQAIRDLEAARMAAHSGVTATSFPPPLLGNPGMMPPMGQVHADAFRRTDGPEKDKDGFPGYQKGAASLLKTPKTGAIEGQSGSFMVSSKETAEGKKKDDEEKAKNAAAKQQDKSRPVSSTPIAGTPWCVVWTGDGRVFFYNPSTRTSVWERPEDLVGRADVDKAIASTPDQVPPPPQAANTTTPTKDDKSKVAATTTQSIAEDASAKLASKRSESESSGENEDVPSKKLKTDENAGSRKQASLAKHRN